MYDVAGSGQPNDPSDHSVASALCSDKLLACTPVCAAICEIACSTTRPCAPKSPLSALSLPLALGAADALLSAADVPVDALADGAADPAAALPLGVPAAAADASALAEPAADDDGCVLAAGVPGDEHAANNANTIANELALRNILCSSIC